jgi:hypothetical protein
MNYIKSQKGLAYIIFLGYRGAGKNCICSVSQIKNEITPSVFSIFHKVNTRLYPINSYYNILYNHRIAMEEHLGVNLENLMILL